MVAVSVPGGMRLRAAYPVALSAMATNAPPCAMPACCDIAGDNGTSISAAPGATCVSCAPMVFIKPCLAKLARMRASNSGSLGVKTFKRCRPRGSLLTSIETLPQARRNFVMSAYGPKRTWPSAVHMSAFGCKADMTVWGCLLLWSLLGVKRTWASAPHMSAFDPKRTWRSQCDPRSQIAAPNVLALYNSWISGKR